MDWTACLQPLGELIDRELDFATQLDRALTSERDALRAVDAAALDSATEWKQRCVERLDGLDAELRQLCTAFGHDPDRAGMERLMQRADPEGRLSPRWQALLGVLENCRETNQHNGVLVRLQKRRVTDALGILHGDAANCTLYGDDGAVDESSGHHVHTEI